MPNRRNSKYIKSEEDNASLNSIDCGSGEKSKSIASDELDLSSLDLHQLLDGFQSEDETKNNVVNLGEILIISSSKAIDTLDRDGRCVLEKILTYLIKQCYKDESDVDVIELVMVKSNLDYRHHKKGLVLQLLKNYDDSAPVTFKLLQWEILCREAEELIICWAMIQQEGERYNGNNLQEVHALVRDIDKAIADEASCMDLMQSILVSGSLELCKYVGKRLEEENLKLKSPLIDEAVFWRLLVKGENVEHFEKTITHIIDKTNKMDISCEDDSNYRMTPLHKADEINDDFMVRKLLENGASITALDETEEFPIQNVSFDTLNNFFDTLITSTPTRFLDDESVWKVINTIFKDKYHLQDFIFMDFNPFLHLQKDGKHKFEDLPFITELSRSQRLCRLIDHPIPATLLEMHWNRFRKWSLLDQFSTLVSLFMLLLYLIKFGVQLAFTEDTLHTVDYIMVAIISFFLLLEALKNYKIFELMLVMCLKLCMRIEASYLPVYQITTSVFLKIPTLVALIIFGLRHCDDKLDSCKEVTGVGVILLSISLTILIAYFHQTVAHCVIMFVYVAFTGIKFILCMVLVIIGFAIGFLTLIVNFKYVEENDQNTVPETVLQSTAQTDAKIEWAKMGLSIFRTFVMATGELEVSTFQFRGVSSYIVCFFFVFVIPIVFFNLLNGLAVGDIALIENESMYWYRKTQLKILEECEQLYWAVKGRKPKKTSETASETAVTTKTHKKVSCVPHIDIYFYPHIIGPNVFIGIDTKTRKIYAMDGLEPAKRKKIGVLSKNILNDAKEILRKSKN